MSNSSMISHTCINIQISPAIVDSCLFKSSTPGLGCGYKWGRLVLKNNNTKIRNIVMQISTESTNSNICKSCPLPGEATIGN